MFSFVFSKRTVLINSTGLRENRAATAGDSVGDSFPKRVVPTLVCLCVYVCLLLLACFVCSFGFSWGLLFYKSYTRIWGTHEIGWMIFRVDSIGEFPYRVGLSHCPLSGGLLEGNDVSALLLSTWEPVKLRTLFTLPHLGLIGRDAMIGWDHESDRLIRDITLKRDSFENNIGRRVFA